jgi:hypothetical protein
MSSERALEGATIELQGVLSTDAQTLFPKKNR